MKEGVTFAINPKVYPLETVYSAAYVFLDRAYVLLDGDPEKEIVITLKSKGGGDLEELHCEFMNELINYADYRQRAKETIRLRELLMQRALLTNVAEKEEVDSVEAYLGKLEDVAIPWDDAFKQKDGRKNRTE
jgi:His-Xaa-Ser system protein HxsD